MAVFDHFSNIYDVAFKPRLLRTLLRDHVPDQNQLSWNPSELSVVLSTIKTHQLLSESVTGSIDQKHIDKWKSSVDSWVDRLLLLCSCNMPDKCWAGTCLFGLTCQECSTDRFLASYSVWFHKLLSHIQSTADSHFLKVASCASISDLLTRLGGFPNAKKDGNSHAGKLIQPILKLLNEDSSEAVWEGACNLLCTIITFYPYSVQHHYDIVEAAIVSKIMSGICSLNMLEKLAASLALLPKSRGNEDCWFLMMQKVLLSINVNLNEAFQGLEEEAKCNEAIRLLVPPGKEPPPPLGGQKMSGEVSDKAARKSQQSLMSVASTMMLCCCKMVATSYPVQVTIPIRALLALVERVLVVDGSLLPTLLPFVTAIQQEFICSQLPTLHSYGLDLLTAIIKRVRSQLLPYVADVVRLLTEYFRTCALPELRIKAYLVIKILLMSMGSGIAVHLAQEVINNAFADLDPIDQGTGGISSSASSKASAGSLLQIRHRKRKHAATRSSEEQLDGVDFEKEVPWKYETYIHVKIAALEALEALLTVGGSLRSEHWRSKVDLLLITVATNACKSGWPNDERAISIPSEATSTQASFQLAALRALLASLLSPARIRPPYLAQGLELFRRGKQETGTRLAEFCSHALLALEVLIHPRALPLDDFSTVNRNSLDHGAHSKYPKNMHFGGQELNAPFSRGPFGMALGVPNLDYDLYSKWLGSDDEIDIPVTDPENRNNVEEASEAFRDHQTEKLPNADVESIPTVAEQIDHRPAATGADMREEETAEEIMVETHRFPAAVVSASTSTGMEIGKVALDSGALAPGNREIATSNDVLVDKGDSFAIQGENYSSAISDSKRRKGSVSELDNESSMDSFPSIVDGDPDSDSD